MRAGLFIIDLNTLYTMCLRKKTPYIDSITQGIDFVEKYSIPRGRCKRNETPFKCAVREYVEETGISLINIKYLPEPPFPLYWEDPIGTKWTYDIFISFAALSALNIKRLGRTWRDEKFERHENVLIPIVEYENQVKSILHLYGPNNYLEFFKKINFYIEKYKNKK